MGIVKYVCIRRLTYLSTVTSVLTDNFLLVDSEQPRALYQKVVDDTQRDHWHLVHNVAVHIKNCKSKEVVARQRAYSLHTSHSYFSYLISFHLSVSVFAAVDQSLSDRIAKAIGAPTVQPLKAKPAAEGVRYTFKQAA